MHVFVFDNFICILKYLQIQLHRHTFVRYELAKSMTFIIYCQVCNPFWHTGELRERNVDSTTQCQAYASLVNIRLLVSPHFHIQRTSSGIARTNGKNMYN